MAIKLSPQLKQQIQQGTVDYALSGDIGGLPKTTYYTPDGRVIRTTPNLHTNSAGGIRDANLDKGWLLAPPVILKLFCPSCDRWHDTQGEVNTCGKKQNLLIDKSVIAAKRDEANEISALKSEVTELKALLNKFMEVQNGKVLQSAINEPAPIPPDERGEGGTGKGKGSV